MIKNLILLSTSLSERLAQAKQIIYGSGKDLFGFFIENDIDI
jgi:hypothetical protein